MKHYQKNPYSKSNSRIRQMSANSAKIYTTPYSKQNDSKTIISDSYLIKRMKTNISDASQYISQENFLRLEKDSWEELIISKSEQYTDLWNQIRRIKNVSAREECKLIKVKTQILEKQLENKFIESSEKCKIIQQQLKNLYQSSHEQFKKLHKIKEGIRAEQLIKIHQIKRLRYQNKKLNDQEFCIMSTNVQYKQLRIEIQTVKNRIQGIKLQIQKKDNQLDILRKEYLKLKSDLVNFYRESLKNGLDYRFFGIGWIISRLLELKYIVKLQDLPQILDKTSKQFLLLSVFENKKKQIKPRQKITSNAQIKQNSTVQTDSKNLSSNRVRMIKKSTKDYITSIIKDNQIFNEKYPIDSRNKQLNIE